MMCVSLSPELSQNAWHVPWNAGYSCLGNVYYYCHYHYVNYQKTILGLKTSAMNGIGGPTDNPVEIYDFEFAEPMYVVG